jgi:hypothetical protein
MIAWKSYVIAEIPKWKNNSMKGLHDSQNSIVRKISSWKRLCGSRELTSGINVSWKGLLDSQRLCESLYPTVKEIPTKMLETTTSCSLNPTVKGIPTERLETTTSCSLNPTAKGIPTKRLKTTKSCSLNPIIKGILLKRPKTTISCGLRSYRRDILQKFWKQLRIIINKLYMFLLGILYAWKAVEHKLRITFTIIYTSVVRKIFPQRG